MSDQTSISPLSEEEKHPKRKILFICFMILALVVVGILGYALGYSHTPQPAPAPQEAPVQTITVPKEAIVTADCETGRGKQYIVPQDIPDGPIYDVREGKVIGVEYIVSLHELTSNPDKFKNLMIQSAHYNHISIIPVDAHAGIDEVHFHLVLYLIPASEVETIICEGVNPSSPMESMPGMH